MDSTVVPLHVDMAVIRRLLDVTGVRVEENAVVVNFTGCSLGIGRLRASSIGSKVDLAKIRSSYHRNVAKNTAELVNIDFYVFVRKNLWFTIA